MGLWSMRLAHALEAKWEVESLKGVECMCRSFIHRLARVESDLSRILLFLAGAMQCLAMD